MDAGLCDKHILAPCLYTPCRFPQPGKKVVIPDSSPENCHDKVILDTFTVTQLFRMTHEFCPHVLKRRRSVNSPASTSDLLMR